MSGKLSANRRLSPQLSRQRLKQDPLTRSIPVIVWSAAAHLHDKESWLAEQGIPILGKPFEIDALYQTIEAALTGKVTDLQLP